MIAFLQWLASSSEFLPHGHCYLWQPATLWLNVSSDGLIAAAYYTIPIGLFYIVRERRTAIAGMKWPAASDRNPGASI